MSKIDDIKQAVRQLSPEEMAAFREWFAELESDLWDEQIERDAKTGKLDKLGAKWRADHEAGRSTELVPPPRANKG